MGDWQLKGGSQRFVSIGNNVLARPIAVYPSGANTKGLWVELTPASTINASSITVMIPEGYGGTDYLIDIGIGPEGSEEVLVENLSMSIGSTSYFDRPPFCVKIPIPIIAGTRIAARCQGSGTSSSRYLRCGIILEESTQSSGGRVITFGADTSDSGGTSIDPGATDNTEGSWVALTEAATFDIKSAFFCFGNKINTARTTCSWQIDIGIGASGFEEVLIPDISLSTHSYPDALFPSHTPVYDIEIPSGVRIVARAKCTITDSTDRLFDLVMYGIL